MVPAIAWQSGMEGMPTESSMDMPAFCIDAMWAAESSLGQAYAANATCIRSNAATRMLVIQRPRRNTVFLTAIMVRMVSSVSTTDLTQIKSVPAEHPQPLRSRRALVITEAELRLIAKAAIIGESNHPVKGYRSPAAIGMPSAL